jgi:hypothetical protein
VSTQRDGADRQKIGKESGRWYTVDANSCYLLAAIPCKYTTKKGNKDYECDACHGVIAKGTEHRVGPDRRHIECPPATRPPTITDAIEMQLYPGYSPIMRMRSKDELTTFKMSKTARFGVGQGANYLRDTLVAKFGTLAGPVEPDIVRAMLISSHQEVEAVAEALMVAAVEEYETEGDEIMQTGTDYHTAMARYWEQGEMPEDEPVRRAILANVAWSESIGTLLRPAVEPRPGAPTWNPRDYPPQAAQVWREVPIADPATASAGTADQLNVTADNVILSDDKTKDFAKIRQFLAKFKTPKPFHIKPWTSDGCQIADYRRIITAKTGVVGQVGTHDLLRQGLTTKPVLCFENYICRTTGENWMLDWQKPRLNWQDPDDKPIHRGLTVYRDIFDSWRLAFLNENSFFPNSLRGYNVDGSPFPGELDSMAADDQNERN